MSGQDSSTLVALRAVVEIDYELDLELYPDVQTPEELVASESRLVDEGDYLLFVMEAASRATTAVTVRDTTGPSVNVSEYTVLPTGAKAGDREVGYWTVRVQARPDGLWAVCWMGEVLTSEGFDYARARDDETHEQWVARHQYDLSTALAKATAVVDTILVNGLTWAEAVTFRSIADPDERAEYRRKTAAAHMGRKD